VSELDQNLAPIVRRPQTADESPIDQPIDQLYRAVMLQLHALGEHANRWLQPFGQAAGR